MSVLLPGELRRMECHALVSDSAAGRCTSTLSWSEGSACGSLGGCLDSH